MTHILQLCEKNLLIQPPSIGRLVLADKHRLTDLCKVCLAFAENSPLETVQHDMLYYRIEPATKVEILEFNLIKMAIDAENANKRFQSIQQLAESSVCKLNHNNRYVGVIDNCPCSKSNTAFQQIKEISITKGHYIRKGP